MSCSCSKLVLSFKKHELSFLPVKVVSNWVCCGRKNCRVFMDQSPEYYIKCTGEINTSEAF